MTAPVRDPSLYHTVCTKKGGKKNAGAWMSENSASTKYSANTLGVVNI